jgi:hypothetical protein
MFEEEYPEFEFAYSDFSRASQAIGVGSYIDDDRYARIQQVLRKKDSSPREKFLEAVQLACYTSELAYNNRVYERIADQYPYPQYLNPKACVFAVAYCLENNLVNEPSFLDEENRKRFADEGLEILDLYRYASFISRLLRI